MSVAQCQAPKASVEAFTDIRFFGISRYQKSNSCYGIVRLKMTESGLLLQRWSSCSATWVHAQSFKSLRLTGAGVVQRVHHRGHADLLRPNPRPDAEGNQGTHGLPHRLPGSTSEDQSGPKSQVKPRVARDWMSFIRRDTKQRFSRWLRLFSGTQHCVQDWI